MQSKSLQNFLHTSSVTPTCYNFFFFFLILSLLLVGELLSILVLLVAESQLALMPYGRQDYARFQADLDRYKHDFPSVSREDGSSILYYSRNLELARARTQNALEAQRDLESLQTSSDVEAGRRAWSRVLQVLDVPDSSLEEQKEEWRSSGGSITQALAALLPSAPDYLSSPPSPPPPPLAIPRLPRRPPSHKRDSSHIARSEAGSPDQRSSKKARSRTAPSPSPLPHPPFLLPRLSPSSSTKRAASELSRSQAGSPEKPPTKKHHGLSQSPYQTPPQDDTPSARQRPPVFQPQSRIGSTDPRVPPSVTAPGIALQWGLPTQPPFQSRTPRHHGPPSRVCTSTRRRRRRRSRSGTRTSHSDAGQAQVIPEGMCCVLCLLSSA
jgi:hypothetical protein